MSSRFQSIFDEAINLYKKNRSHDAAVTFEQAKQIAKEYSLSREAAEAGVWAAISWHEACCPIKALNLLIEILSGSDVDLDVMDSWRARKRRFLITLCYSPELEKLEKLLENLKLFQQEHPQLPIADVYQNEALLRMVQGRWKDALTKYELAWSTYDDEGYVKHSKAFNAGLCNLYLDKHESTQRWCQLLKKTDTEFPASQCSHYILDAEMSLYLKKWAEAENYATQAENKADLIQESEVSYRARFLKIRTLLLQNSLRDPAQTSDPARYRLRQKHVGKPDLHATYKRALLLADYRLACVRYVVRIQPVDDLWYRQPQQIPTKLPANFKKSDFQKRVQLVDRCIRYAMRQAKHLDDCFQCTWRQEEVQQRLERLYELVNIVNSLNKPR
jgi:hypothetical protein